MALFNRQASLHELHAAAHAVGQDARAIFLHLADALEDAARRHTDVAVAAQAQITDLSNLRDSAADASVEASRQADAVRGLVS